jgi:hypothetical protein
MGKIIRSAIRAPEKQSEATVMMDGPICRTKCEADVA